MFEVDQYFLLEWLSAWLVLNWGAHLALSRRTEEDNLSGSEKRQWPRLNEQFTFILNSAVIGWLIQWSWQLLPPIGWALFLPPSSCELLQFIRKPLHFGLASHVQPLSIRDLIYFSPLVLGSSTVESSYRWTTINGCWFSANQSQPPISLHLYKRPLLTLLLSLTLSFYWNFLKLPVKFSVYSYF